MAIPKLPKLFDGKGLPSALQPLANRVQEWASGTQDTVRALREFAEKTDFFNALRINGIPVQRTKPTDGQVLTVEKGATEANWADPAGGAVGSDSVTNESGVAGANVSDALDQLDTDIGALGSDDIANESGVAGVTVSDALDALAGGGSTTPIWMPEAEPASLSALDDFFDGSGPSWTTFAHAGGYITQTEDTTRRCLLMSGTGNGTTRVEGRLQAIPSSEFTAYVWCGLHGTHVAANMQAGLVITNGTANTSGIGGAFHVIRPSATADRVGHFLYNDFDTDPGFTLDWSDTLGKWFRLRVNGTAYEVDASRDGYSWHTFVVTTFPSTPSHVGIVSDIFSGTSGFMFRNFQVIDGVSGFDDSHIGRIVNVGV